MAEYFSPDDLQQQLGYRAHGDARRRFAGRRPLQHVARFRQVVFESAGQIGVPGTRRGHSLILRRIARCHRQRLFPVLPVTIFDAYRNGRANGLAMAYS